MKGFVVNWIFTFACLALTFVLGMSAGINVQQDKGVKKPDQKKAVAKDSLVQKYDQESFKIYKELKFLDSKSLKLDGKKGAEKEAGYLNEDEEMLLALEKIEASALARKDKVPAVLVESRKLTLDLIKARAKFLKSFLAITEIGSDPRLPVYCLDWKNGQWIAKELEKKPE